ncbi:hypothetical protein RP20_CCG008802 [Aedes albopictus]|nr:hypothetical protein RP20_CCG008802 [Aedes albopictus]
MVNNPYLADVKFLVGNKRKRIYAHRTLLSCSSEVFKAMFGNKRFLQIHKNYPLIVVLDVEPDIFLDVLYYIYCDVCDISKQNVIPLFNAATKYLLYELQSRCAKFMIANMEVSDWIQIFCNESRNQRLREICEDQLVKRAVEVFEHHTFLQLTSSQVKEIMQLKGLECTDRRLLEGLDRWIEHQPESQRSEIDSLRLDLSRKLVSNNNVQVRPSEEDQQPYFSGVIMASRNTTLYGMGIYTGIDCAEVEEAEVSLLIEIGCCERDTIRKSIQLRIPEKETRITECFFNRLRLAEGDMIKVKVQIVGMPSKLRKAWCADSRDRTFIVNKDDLKIVSSDNARFVTPIAYLIYDAVEQ